MFDEFRRRLRVAWSMAQLSELTLRPQICPMCGPSLFIRLCADSSGVRCIRCAGSAIATSLAAVLRSVCPEFGTKRVYELSSQGPLFEFLHREVTELTWSEYFEDVSSGQFRGRVQCQNVERLTFADASFDICTSTEVFEHVADDAKGFAEIRRVLRKGGLFVFTVPLTQATETVERAAVRNGSVQYLLPPTYHDDRLRGRGHVLVFRDYGLDITRRLERAGFSTAQIDARFEKTFLGFGRSVVVARV